MGASTSHVRLPDDHCQNLNGTDTEKKLLVDENTNSTVMEKFTLWSLLIWNQKMKALTLSLLPIIAAPVNMMLTSRLTALHDLTRLKCSEVIWLLIMVRTSESKFHSELDLNQRSSGLSNHDQLKPRTLNKKKSKVLTGTLTYWSEMQLERTLVFTSVHLRTNLVPRLSRSMSRYSTLQLHHRMLNLLM